MEIFPDVHWLDLGISNVYLAADADGLTLVDAGMLRQTRKILSSIARLGYQPDALRRIVITHADIDHAGSLAALVQATGAAVYAGSPTAALLRHGRSPEHMPGMMQFLAGLFRYGAVAEVNEVADGDELPCLGGLRVIAAPGHTLEHHAFFSPSTGVLFAGDALNTRQDRLNLTPKPITADMALARQSARLLLNLRPRLFACGHGRPLRDLPANDLARFLEEV
ncbi:MAG: MBL fold metallo-hydrolase [Candidatus Promineifilaceae bacterium]